MAGHSKWSKIKRDKQENDKQRGAAFAKIASKIIRAVYKGGDDPNTNADLASAIQLAKQAHMPNDVIKRNISKIRNNVSEEKLIYEFYALDAVGMIVIFNSDNSKRVLSDLRSVLSRHGIDIASPGAVLFLFNHIGVLEVSWEESERPDLKEDDFVNILWEFDVIRINYDPKNHECTIWVSYKDLLGAQKKLLAEGVDLDSSDKYVPHNSIECNEATFHANMVIVNKIYELMNVDSVYHNMSM